MSKLTKARSELLELDALAAGNSPIHTLHPVAKLLTTVFYIYTVVSFPKYDLTGLTVMVLYPVILYQIAGIRVSDCFYRLRVVLPLVCMVGLVNPFLDQKVLLYLGTIPITGGILSMLTLMLKGVFSLMASFLLIATTSMDSLCAGLRKLHVPAILTTLLLLTYRYIGLMIEQVSIMTESYALRAPNQTGIHFSAWGSFLGQLLLRSQDRAQELYESMLLRGFSGEFYYARIPNARVKDYLFCLGSFAVLAVARFYDLPELLGGILMR